MSIRCNALFSFYKNGSSCHMSGVLILDYKTKLDVCVLVHHCTVMSRLQPIVNERVEGFQLKFKLGYYCRLFLFVPTAPRVGD